jgi:WD40 repeat protein
MKPRNRGKGTSGFRAWWLGKHLKPLHKLLLVILILPAAALMVVVESSWNAENRAKAQREWNEHTQREKQLLTDINRLEKDSDENYGRFMEVMAGQIRARESAPRAEGGQLMEPASTKQARQACSPSQPSETGMATNPGTGPEMVMQTGHNDEIACVAFSPDGKRVLTGSRDRTAMLWDAQTGHKLREFSGYARAVSAVAFSPDGKRVLASSTDGAAALWDAESGRKLLSFPSGPEVPNRSKQWEFAVPVAFAGDPEKALIGGQLWNTRSGERLATLDQVPVWSLAMSGNGARLLIGRDNNYLREPIATLWDTRSWKKLQSFKNEFRIGEFCRSAALSPDGKRAFAAYGGPPVDVAATGKTPTEHNAAILWETDSERLVRRFDTMWINHSGPSLLPYAHDGAITAVAFFPDGKKLLTGSLDKTAIIWDSAVKRGLRVLEGHTAYITSVAISPDGRSVVTGSSDRTAILWDADSGQKLRSLESWAGRVRSLAVGPDGRHIITGSDDATASLWDAGLGQQVRRFRGHTAPVLSVAFDHESKQILTNSGDATAIVWNSGSGQKLQTLQRIADAHTRGEYLFSGRRGSTYGRRLNALAWGAFTPDGTHVCAFPGDAGLQWDVRTGEKSLLKTGGHAVLAISADAKQIAVVGYEKDRGFHVEIRDALTGERNLWFSDSRSLDGIDPDEVDLAAFSPDGKQLLLCNQKIGLWDTARFRKLCTFEGPNARYSSVAFSPDGTQVVTSFDAVKRGDSDAVDYKKVDYARSNALVLWDTKTGRLLRRFEGHTDGVDSVTFSVDGRRVLSGSLDGTTRIWDAATGQELARLISLHAGTDWAVITPEGLFDGSRPGREQVFYRTGNGNELVPLDRFFQDFYYPGLLAEIWRGERPMPGKPLQINPAPIIKLLVNQETTRTGANEVAIDVAVTDQGGGVKGPWLQQNGVTLSAGKLLKNEGKTQQYRFDVALLSGDNRIEVRAATADGAVESAPAITTVKFDGKLPEPDLYVIAVGINRFAKEAGVASLDFCVPDAKGIADLFRDRAGKLYHQVQVTALYDEQATKANILMAVTELASKARPQDTLVLYVASHGYTVGQRFYLFPHDFRLGKADSPARVPNLSVAIGLRGYRGMAEQEGAVREHGLAIDELGEVLATVPALKRVLIFDTCHSGSAISLAGKQQNPFAFRGAIERFSRAQGVYSLSATAADELAAESRELKHSILTYSLLAGMDAVDAGPLKGQVVKAGAGNGVDVLDWFRFAKAQVPALYEKYIGRPQHVELSGDDQPGFAIFRN